MPPRTSVVSKVRIPTKAQVRTFRTRLLSWFEVHGRDFPWREPGASLFEQLVAELLLQRTRAESVAARLPSILAVTPDWLTLSGASDELLQEALRPLGLWRRRAASLRLLASAVHAAGELLPDTRTELEKLPGVGQYMASAILVICGVEPAPYLDVNMARVLERQFGPRRLQDIRYDPDLQTVAAIVTRSTKSREVNWAILDLAALVCTSRKPDCSSCPVRRTCDFYRCMTPSPFP